MAAAAARQTNTVALSPPGFLYDIIDKVWVVALAVNVGRFFCGLSAVLYMYLCFLQVSVGASNSTCLMGISNCGQIAINAESGIHS